MAIKHDLKSRKGLKLVSFSPLKYYKDLYNQWGYRNLHKIEAAFINIKIGREFKTQKIIVLVKFKYEINDSSIIPSDYCYNRMNLGKWKNPQLLDFNIFEYVDKGLYRYLGGSYIYNNMFPVAEPIQYPTIEDIISIDVQ